MTTDTQRHHCARYEITGGKIVAHVYKKGSKYYTAQGSPSARKNGMGFATAREAYEFALRIAKEYALAHKRSVVHVYYRNPLDHRACSWLYNLSIKKWIKRGV